MDSLFIYPDEWAYTYRPSLANAYGPSVNVHEARCLICERDRKGGVWMSPRRYSDVDTMSLAIANHMHALHPSTRTAAWYLKYLREQAQEKLRRSFAELDRQEEARPNTAAIRRLEPETDDEITITTEERPMPAFKRAFPEATTPRVEELNEQIEQERAKLEKYRSKLDKSCKRIDELRIERGRASIPDEPGCDGTVIRYELELSRVSGGARVYRYAAIRVGDRWFTTGSTCPPNGWSWAALVGQIRNARSHSNIEILSPRDELIIPS